ncbi:MAG: prenyltransferase [Chloroflexota bacterium]
MTTLSPTDSLRLFVRLSRPLFLVGVMMLYALGVGIARYLGNNIDWNTYFLGQVWVTLLQLSTHYFNEYYNSPADQENPNRTYLTGGSGALGPGKLPRQVAMTAALISLALLAWMTVMVIANLRPGLLAYLIMGLAFLGAFFYSVPPVRLEASGYGELTTTVLVAFLVPAFGFVLQTGNLHRLLAMCAFPLAALHLAMLLAFELPDYGVDAKHDKCTLMVRMGWQNGMLLHNILVLSAFLLLALAASLGLPGFVAWPSLLLLPLGLLQIYQMRGIAAGGKPRWTALVTGALALFGLLAYIMMMTFWIN